MSTPQFRAFPSRHSEILKAISNSEYLNSDDLLGKDWTFEILAAGMVTIEKNAVVTKSADKVAVRFRGPKKPFAFGVTVYRSIVRLYGEPGPGGQNWIGKLVTIYPTTTKGREGIVGCIRVRDTRPTKPSSEPLPETPVNVDAAVAKAKAMGDLPSGFDPNAPPSGDEDDAREPSSVA